MFNDLSPFLWNHYVLWAEATLHSKINGMTGMYNQCYTIWLFCWFYFLLLHFSFFYSVRTRNAHATRSFLDISKFRSKRNTLQWTKMVSRIFDSFCHRFDRCRVGKDFDFFFVNLCATYIVLLNKQPSFSFSFDVCFMKLWTFFVPVCLFR